MDKFEYTVTTDRPFGEAVQTVERKAAELNFRVCTRTMSQQHWQKRGFLGSP
jgi:hypothetical protein